LNYYYFLDQTRNGSNNKKKSKIRHSTKHNYKPINATVVYDRVEQQNPPF